ncbi:preprotein translocase subunit YajC [Clostridium collagenovorans DSM 3089]|uniref:Preprotein translocase subunit YajC n=1 Tax=Clostridium collagenovorans DSM 3089 TaxID=1121306 RepID=A0A1M5YD11_9CLOT|nr:preprotein translocase subunit YajC [Clostridium collagenovorans]SHI09950.1 preprotein translocase subunit YajC [Clostridium collagenovorans DSM 3089]
MNIVVQLLPFIVMMVVLYLIIFLPEKKRKKQYEEMINSLKVNDEIMTKGGVMGRITSLKDDYIILESGPDRSRIKFTKQAIASVITPEETVSEN